MASLIHIHLPVKFKQCEVSRRTTSTLFQCVRKGQWNKSHNLGSSQQYLYSRLRRPTYQVLTSTIVGRKIVQNKSTNSKSTSWNSSATWLPPTSGILSSLPASWRPYAELIRLDKPTGAYYLFFPCLFSTLAAATTAVPYSPPSSVLKSLSLFLIGAFVMRGAGCTINDLWDRNLDSKVSRTRLRPIARGIISPFKALIFTGAQLIVGFGILLQFPFQCLFYGIPSLLLVTTYPLAKRFTDYPQVVLGMTFSWGAIMGFPALGVDLLQNSSALATALLIYCSNIAWTILYDMIYAHMDIKDDAKAGIKSIALRHNKYTKQVLSGLALAQISLLALAGIISESGPLFFVSSCGGSALTLAIMIKKIDLKSVKDCWWWFVNGCWITGGMISTGLALDYLVKYSHNEDNVASKASKLS